MADPSQRTGGGPATQAGEGGRGAFLPEAIVTWRASASRRQILLVPLVRRQWLRLSGARRIVALQWQESLSGKRPPILWPCWRAAGALLRIQNPAATAWNHPAATLGQTAVERSAGVARSRSALFATVGGNALLFHSWPAHQVKCGCQWSGIVPKSLITPG